MSNIPVKFEVKGAPGTQNLPEVKAPEPLKTNETGTKTPEPQAKNISNG